MQDFVEVPLTRGKVALIDRADMLIVGAHEWQAGTGNRGRFYARRMVVVGGVRRNEMMHRRIMEPPPGMVVDHINHDGLDNRRANLRVCTVKENAANQATLTISKKSKYRGIAPRDGKWVARIYKDKRYVHLGRFVDAESAARAYDVAARESFGAFATLNFPGDESNDY